MHPSAQVFAESASRIHVTPVPGTKYILQQRVSTTTVANEAFGVRAGSPIDLLILVAAGPVPLTIGISTSTADMQLLGAYAQDASLAPVSHVVEQWLAQTA